MGQLLLMPFLMLYAVFRPSLSSEWSYNDVASWPLGFAECGGHSQSPVDFTAVETFTTEPFTFINYGMINTSLQNNGHSLKVLLPDLPLEKKPRVTGGGLGATYVLDSFHFHWGSTSHQGSEHRLNGCAFAGEMHLVHVKEGYGSVSEALNHKDGLAVLGVWLTEDQGRYHGPPHHHRNHHRTDEDDADVELEDHTMKDYEEDRKPSSPNWWLAALTPSSPTIQSAHTTLNLRHLLPEDVHTFYRYNGSLTTPPCTENVLWTVMATPVKAPRRFLRGLRAMVNPHTTSGHGDHIQNNHLEVSGATLISDNFRPTRPIESRKVFFSGDLEERPMTCCSQKRLERRECLVFPPLVVVGAGHGEREKTTVTEETARMQDLHEPGKDFILSGDKLMKTEVETVPNPTVEVVEDDLRELDSEKVPIEESLTLAEESQMLNSDEAAKYQTMNEEVSFRMKRDAAMIENDNVVNEEETIAEGEYLIERVDVDEQTVNKEEYPSTKGVSGEEYYCYMESPLNLHLRDSEVVSAPHLAWRRVGDCNTVSVANDGRVLKARFSTDAPIWELVGGNLNNDRYFLAEMVLRWSSEHHLAGFSFPLEVQLVHYNTRYSSLREALSKPDGVVVVAKLFQEPVGVWGTLDWLHDVGGGHNNPLHTLISPIQHHQVKEAGREAIVESPDIPLLMGYMSSYYEYRGALPHAPPCSTPATWIVLRKVGEVSRQQVSALRTLLDNTNTTITANPRPVFYSPGRNVTLRVNSPHLAQEFQSILSLAKRDIGNETSDAKQAPEPPKQAPEPSKLPNNAPVVKESGSPNVRNDGDGNGGYCTTPALSMVWLVTLLLSLLY